MRIRDLVKTVPTTLTPDDSLDVADKIMSLIALRHLPVVRGGRVVGILSQRDILRAPITAWRSLATAPAASAVLKALTVRDMMTTEVVTVGADSMVERAAELLLQRRVGCLPVLQDGTLVGVVTTSDVLRAIVDSPAREPAGSDDRFPARAVDSSLEAR